MARVEPMLGCGVHTVGRSRKPVLWVVQTGIKLTQKWAMKIPAPYWKCTHSMGYTGRLREADIAAAARAGTISSATASELERRADWCFSMTDPGGIWVPYEQLLDEYAGRGLFIARPRFCTFNEAWQVSAWHHVCWWWIGRRYDRHQLFNILLNELGERDPKHYSRILPDVRSQTVCSGALGSCYEGVRRQGILRSRGEHRAVEWIYCDEGLPGGVWDLNIPWPRILNGMHLERIAPGHLCLPHSFNVYTVG